MLGIGTKVIVDGQHSGLITAISPYGYAVALAFGEALAHWDGESYSAATGEPLLASD